MTQRRRDTKAILRTVAQSEQRSPLFRWMVEHHDELVEASRLDRIHWANFCAEASKRGLTDTQGNAPTTATARKTWTRARRAVREAQAELTARPPKPVYPSRLPKGWVPPEILAAIEAGSPAVEGTHGSAAARGTGVAPSPGNALVPRPPPPVPAKSEAGKTLSRYAKPEDPPEVQAAYAAIEEQLDQADWWLMGGTSNKRRTD